MKPIHKGIYPSWSWNYPGSLSPLFISIIFLVRTGFDLYKYFIFDTNQSDIDVLAINKTNIVNLWSICCGIVVCKCYNVPVMFLIQLMFCFNSSYLSQPKPNRQACNGMTTAPHSWYLKFFFHNIYWFSNEKPSY